MIETFLCLCYDTVNMVFMFKHDLCGLYDGNSFPVETASWYGNGPQIWCQDVVCIFVKMVMSVLWHYCVFFTWNKSMA